MTGGSRHPQSQPGERTGRVGAEEIDVGRKHPMVAEVRLASHVQLLVVGDMAT